MDKREWNVILKNGEGLNVEFKEAFDSKSFTREIVAFANTRGGRIFLGVSDDGLCKGINVTNRLKSQIQDSARKCEPSINVKLEFFENVLIINVFEGKDKPYQCSSGFFIREGSNSQKLSREEIIGFVREVGKVNFDEQVNKEFNFAQDFDREKFLDFLKRCNLSMDNELEVLLTNLSLGIRSGGEFKIYNAGILFFGKQINKFIRQNSISCVLYKGTERVNIIDRKEFVDDILSNYENALKFLQQHLKLSYIIKDAGARQEVLEIPLGALREAVLNAVAHRDYFNNSGIFVEIFDDRVEIYNSGKLLFNEKELGKISIPRNPIIFDLLQRRGLIEKAGSGINRIKSLVKERGLFVKFEISSFFRVVFMKSVTPQITPQIPTELEQKILNVIKEKPVIGRAEIANVLKLSEETIKEYLKKLKIKGLLRRIGADKGGHWEIIKRKEEKR